MVYRHTLFAEKRQQQLKAATKAHLFLAQHHIDEASDQGQLLLKLADTISEG